MKKLKKNTSNEFAYFNILRFIAAITIAVLLHWNDHLLPSLGLANPFIGTNSFMLYISTKSFLFVELFFIISGILFSNVYIDRIISKDSLSFKKFITSRYIRIFSLVIISSIVMYILHYIYYRSTGVFFSCGNLNFIDLLGDMLIGGFGIFKSSLTSVNGPVWYVGSLMVAYVIAYFLTSKLFSKNKSYFVYCIPIFVGVMIIKTNYSFLMLNINNARAFVAFFIGVFIGNKSLLSYIKNNIRLNKIIKVLSLIIISVFIYSLTRSNSILFIGDYYGEILSYAFIFFPALIMLLHGSKIVERINNTNLFNFLGNISFGIYIWNFPILIVWAFLIKNNLINIDVTSYMFIIINTIVHILVASLSYIFIEKKLINYLKSIIKV